MNKKKLLSLIVLVALLFVLVTPLLYSNQANVAKAVCQEMRCDCYVPYQYHGGKIWRGRLDSTWFTCSDWKPITPCLPYC